MNNNIVTKEEKQKRIEEAITELSKSTLTYEARCEVIHSMRDKTSEYMMEQLEIEAEHREHELKVMDRLMKERSEINIERCKGRY